MVSLKIIKVHRYTNPPCHSAVINSNRESDSKDEVIWYSTASQNQNERPLTKPDSYMIFTLRLSRSPAIPTPTHTPTPQHSHKRLFLDLYDLNIRLIQQNIHKLHFLEFLLRILNSPTTQEHT